MTSTELRQFNIESKKSESGECYILHRKAQDICRDFLPPDCPIVSKILQSFEVMQPDDKPRIVEGDLFSEPMVTLAGLSRKTSKTRLLSPITSVDGSCHSVHSTSVGKRERLMSPEEKRPTSKERKLYDARGSHVDRLYMDTKSNLKNIQRLSQVKIPVKKKNIGFNNNFN